MADGTVRTALTMEVGPFIGSINKVVGKLTTFAGRLGVVGGAFAAVGSALAIFAGVQVFKASKEIYGFQLQVVELAKVLNDVGQARNLAERIGELSRVMPVARAELFNVAEIAARLGIRGTKNIMEFTRVASMMGVATNLSADQAADAFARILKQTNTPISQFEALGSVVNELANNMATSTSEIVENMRRTAPEFSRLGLTAGEIAALSATINEVSESATRAGTRLRRFAQSIADPNKLLIFSKALRMNLQDLNRKMQSEPMQGVLDIVKAFKDGGEAADKMAAGLDSRVRQALAQLAQNYDSLNDAIKIYNEQMKESTSLTREYDLFANTLSSSQQLMKNRLEDTRATIGQKLAPTMQRFWMQMLKLADAWDEVFSDPLDIVADPHRVDTFRESVRELIEDANELRKAFPFNYTDLTFKELTQQQEKFGGRTGKQYIIDLDKNRQAMAQYGTDFSNTVLRGLSGLQAGSEQAFAIIANDFNRFRTTIGKHFGEGTAEFSAYLKGYQADTTAFISAWDSLMETMMSTGGIPEAAMLRFNVTMTQLNELIRQEVIDVNTLTKVLPSWQTYLLKTAEAAADLAKKEKWTEAANELYESLIKQIRGMTMTESAQVRLTDAYKNGSKAQRDDIDAALARIDALKAAERQEKRMQEEIDRSIQNAQELADIRRQEAKDSEDALVAIRGRLQLARAETDLDRLIIRQKQEKYDWLSKIESGMQREAEAEIDKLHAMELAAEKAKEYGDSLKQLQKRIAEMKLETIASQFRLMERIIEGIADSMVEAFDAIVTGSGNAGEAVIQMIRDIANELLKAQIMGFLFDLAQKWKIGPFGAMEKASAERTTTGYGPFIRAAGGPLKAGQFAIVGEKGPEIFVPRVSGNVVPNKQLGGDSVTIVNHYTIQALDGASVRHILTKEQDTIAGLAIDKINRHRSLKRL